MADDDSPPAEPIIYAAAQLAAVLSEVKDELRELRKAVDNHTRELPAAGEQALSHTNLIGALVMAPIAGGGNILWSRRL